jgi:hypothetical protein
MKNLTPQAPAEGISLNSDWGVSKIYKIDCQCGCSANHNLCIEVDQDSFIWARIYAEVKTNYWSEFWPKRYDIKNNTLQWLDWTVKDLINGLVTRVKLTWTIWTRGYIKCEQDILLTRQQALNYSETLRAAVQDVENYKNQQL